MMKRTLVISLANQGYQYLYRRNLQSHQRYADRFGYDYLCLSRPVFSPLGAEVVWLKLYAIRSALLNHYDWVMFIDADAVINPQAPMLNSLHKPGKSVYMAKGYSGRFNSGVIIVERKPAALAFISEVIDAMEAPLDFDDDVGWGENGHVIACAHDNPAIEEIDQRWNNNFQPELEDYIRHYSAGPLRAEYCAGVLERSAFWATQTLCKILKRLVKMTGVHAGDSQSKKTLLEQAYFENQKHYSALKPSHDSVQDEKTLQSALRSGN